MKTVYLGLILAAYLTGLWPALSPQNHLWLANRAVDPNRVTAVASPPPQLPVAGPWPVQTGQERLRLPAAAGMAVDVSSGTVLYTQNTNQQLPIASITKLMTSLVILSGHNLTDTITIPQLPTYLPEDEVIGLQPGEAYQLQDLIRALLVQSANDAADALAIADAGSLPKFAAKMNAKLTDWNINGARFVSASGLTDAGNYATAEALTKIGRLALTNAFIRQTIAEQADTITSGAGRVIILQTTNQLLSTGNFYGIKTGYTLAAGECFVGLTRINGHEVVTVVLGANDRFGNTQTLVNWITRNWQWL